jgi:hypothetical protein
MAAQHHNLEDLHKTSQKLDVLQSVNDGMCT